MYDEFDCTFKDDVAEDIRTFLDVEEFSELADVNGVILRCQISAYTSEKSGRQNENYDGLHGDFTTIFFETAPYIKKRARLPREGEKIYINGKRFEVAKVKDEMGIAKIICGAYRQNTLSPKPFLGGRTNVYNYDERA